MTFINTGNYRPLKSQPHSAGSWNGRWFQAPESLFVDAPDLDVYKAIYLAMNRV